MNKPAQISPEAAFILRKGLSLTAITADTRKSQCVRMGNYFANNVETYALRRYLILSNIENQFSILVASRRAMLALTGYESFRARLAICAQEQRFAIAQAALKDLGVGELLTLERLSVGSCALLKQWV